MKAFLITHKDFTDLPPTIIAAKNAGQAKSLVAGTLREYRGYSFFEAVRGMSCRRVPELDDQAQSSTFEKVIGG